MLQSDASGFLVGTPMAGDAVEGLLSDIKGDTAAILAVMTRAGRMASAASRRTGPARASAAGGAEPRGVAHPPVTATPKRATYLAQPRDERGRFVAAGAAAGAARRERGGAPRSVAQARSQAAAEPRPMRVAALAAKTAADAATDTARTLRAQHAADAREKRTRDAKGRFGSGGAKDPDAPAPTAASRWLSAARQALGRGAGTLGGGNGESVDPAIAAAGEVATAVRTGMGVASPLLKAFKRKDEADADAQKTDAKEERRQTRLLTRIAALLTRRGAAAGAVAGAAGLPSLPGMPEPLKNAATTAVAAGAGATLAAAARAAARGAGALAKRLPLVGVAIELVDAAIENSKLDDRKDLSEADKSRERSGIVGGAGGALAGAVGGAKLGALAGSVFGPAGTVAGGVIGGAAGAFAGSKAGKELGRMVHSGLGWLSAKEESGGRGAGTVSTGKGDAGGVSYGTHQLSSTRGTVGKFLQASGYADKFSGLTPGTPEFSARWRQVAASDPAFGKAQHDYITTTHYQPQVDKLKAAGLDLTGRGAAVQEAIYSTSVQYGPRSGVIKSALGDPAAVAGMSDADIVARIQDYKAANNETLMRNNSPEVRASVLQRIGRERAQLIGMANTPAMPAAVAASAAIPKLQPPPALPQPVAPTAPAVASIPPASAGPALTTPTAPQEVADRAIAHIVGGGIGHNLLAR